MLIWQPRELEIRLAVPDRHDEVTREIAEAVRAQLLTSGLMEEGEERVVVVSLPEIGEPTAEVSVLLVGVSDELLGSLGRDTFESWAKSRKEAGFQVLPFRIGGRQIEHSLVEMDYEALAADGVAELLIRRLRARKAALPQRLDLGLGGLEHEGEVDDALRSALEELIRARLREGGRGLRATPEIDVVLPPLARAIRKQVLSFSSVAEHPAATEVARGFLERAEKSLCREIAFGIEQVLDAVVSFDLETTAACDTMELFVLAEALSLSFQLSRADLPYEGLPPWLERLRAHPYLERFDSALICLLRRRGLDADFWVEAELEEEGTGRHHRTLFVPSPPLVKAAVEGDLEPPWLDVFYPAIAPQLLDRDDGRHEAGYTLAFPSRFKLRVTHESVIDAPTLRIGTRQHPLGGETRRCVAQRVRRLVAEREPDANAERLALLEWIAMSKFRFLGEADSL